MYAVQLVARLTVAVQERVIANKEVRRGVGGRPQRESSRFGFPLAFFVLPGWRVPLYVILFASTRRLHLRQKITFILT